MAETPQYTPEQFWEMIDQQGLPQITDKLNTTFRFIKYQNWIIKSQQEAMNLFLDDR